MADLVVTTGGPSEGATEPQLVIPTSGPVGGGTSLPDLPGVAGGTILAVIQQVCTVVGLPQPASVFSSTDREHRELAALANEMANRIAIDTHDWSRLKTQATFTGDGVLDAFDLPEDYGRMLKVAQLWPSDAPSWPLEHVADADRWLGLQSQNLSLAHGRWMLLGDQILISPPPSDGGTVSFFYLSRLFARGVDGASKAYFTADDDSFVLNSRVLKLAMIWQWKALKGFSYAEDMTNYENALASQVGADKGSNILTVGRRGHRLNVGVAYPGTLG